ncbi:hypothetical protein PISL3812_01834 [Talaromyces islandicus]|uniref:V-type ATPase assembly factor PKR1 n=1 Tax=Talaromyces islandicus TaxID=28573 RepID=A0A0U1LNI1_TALIS|nr:hypothetical protein PISL3812_01834 [Talaromyces islandicus]
MGTSFFEDLWSSVFTPGPTPTLLVATNATFAALQLVLFTLLIATYSVHFVVLSFLSGALWYSINWFAKEVREVQAAQQKEEEKQQKKLAESNDSLAENSGSGTETETEGVSTKPRRRRVNQPPDTAPATAVGLPGDDNTTLRQRESTGNESSGYTSTDSEWEKVDKSA